MGKGISIDGLSGAIFGILNEYSDYVSAETKEVIKKAGQTAVKEIKAAAPKDTGKYAKNWKSKVVSETANTVHVSVYAESRSYSLTHLLENGHAKRGGGRVAAIPHIEPAERKIIEQVAAEIEGKL